MSKKKVLIVDDSEVLRLQLRGLLEGEGFEVLEAFDGMEGMECFMKTPDIKLIICDVNMPRLDGLGMCELLSKDDRGAKVPVFMLTTEASHEMKEKGKRVGVRAWLTKPFAPDKLVSAVKKIAA
jgi:two-component system chemotaxis response regulator CheY